MTGSIERERERNQRIRARRSLEEDLQKELGTSLTKEDLSRFRLYTSLFLTTQMMTYLIQNLLAKHLMSQSSESQMLHLKSLVKKIERKNNSIVKKLKTYSKGQGFVLPYVPKPVESQISRLERLVQELANSPENYGTPETWRKLEEKAKEVVSL